jgi:ADP-heptose:LPS heptosyltransferase
MASRIALLKAVDGLLGRLAVSFARLFSLKAKRSGPISSILLIRPGGIGDAVHLVPAIQAIRQTYPAAKITVLAERRNASVFSLCHGITDVLLYDRPADLMAALRGTYDVAIDTEQWHRLSAVVARLTRAPLLIGYGTNERSRLFTHPMAYSHDDYELDSFLHLLTPLGIEPAPPGERFLVVPRDAARNGDELLAPLTGQSFVALFPGAIITERRW